MLQQLEPDVNLGGTRRMEQDDYAPSMLALPLQDALLSKNGITEAMPRLLKQCLQRSLLEIDAGGAGQGSSAIAMALSMGMTVRSALTSDPAPRSELIRHTQDDNRIHPIPAEAFTAWKTYFASSANLAPLIQSFQPDSWTLFVFHECTAATDVDTIGPKQQPEVRYAFYTPLETGEARVEDSSGFFQDALLAEKWNKAMADLEPYGEPRIEEGRRRYQRGAVGPARQADVQGALKLVERYNMQVLDAAAELVRRGI